MFGPSRVFHHREYPARALLDAKQDHVVTLCLPAKDEAATVGAIVGLVRRRADGAGAAGGRDPRRRRRLG